MGKKLNGSNGISIKLLTEKLKKEMTKTEPQKKSKKKRMHMKIGHLKTSDLKNISIGLHILQRITHEGFSAYDKQLLLGNKDISKIQKEIASYKGIMEYFLQSLANSSIHEYKLQKKIDSLADYSQIAQAARDGILIKQDKRIEYINGKEKEIKYDTSMTPREVISILNNYEIQANSLKFNKLDNYLGLGLGLAGAIGAMAKNSQNKDDSNSNISSLVTMGTTVICSLKLLQGLMKSNDQDKLFELKDKELRMIDDLFSNEQISNKSEKSSMQNIETIVNQERTLGNKIENKRLSYNIVFDLVVALISGAYINSKLQTKENGKIDGKSLASALISLQNTKGIVGHFFDTTKGIVDNRKEEEEFKKTCKKVQKILIQMEEKVYPLKGAKHSFDSISINNFTGKFYPKKDYYTGEIKYNTIINVPEFSIKRGDVVLLSGESGTGKSTFLRFLKRGDINNRQVIKLDNCEMVDNLGNEYVSFRPSINLGDETNVLYQITGKKNITDLTEDEQKKLEAMLRELKFDIPNLLEQLASKKFMEFSTGQQRRLALSKVFYRIDDATSVIIVDEPVGNVEDNLIREQLEMIKKYAETKNAMLILTTHRLDLAEDLANKRYNINKDGIVEQLPIKNTEKNDEVTR